MVPVIASTTRPATGSTSCRHAGRVSSTQPVRVQACASPPAAGRPVTASSQRSASRHASTTWVVSAAVTGRSAARVACVATSAARSQFTGPPVQLISFCSCPNMPAEVAPTRPRPPRTPPRPNGSLPPPAGLVRVVRPVGGADAERRPGSRPTTARGPGKGSDSRGDHAHHATPGPRPGPLRWDRCAHGERRRRGHRRGTALAAGPAADGPPSSRRPAAPAVPRGLGRRRPPGAPRDPT
jgi:hypothetical protein